MPASSLPFVAHIVGDTSWSVRSTILAVVSGCFLGLLVLRHLQVKHGRLHLRHLRSGLAAAVAVAVAATAAPTPGFAQSPLGPMGLPDLISDPPFIWIERDLDDIDGDVIRVLSFDGFLHNIGSGALDLAGNPQIEGGVKQRVFDGENWEEVGSPLVRFETDDGHNHFHLINAATYTLWNEAQTEQVNLGSKIGFCLLDTRQVERGVDAFYNIDEIDYCNVDQPESTDLRMGISPGWVDIYEASITLQWVDVSNTAPGRYWIGAIIDPNNEIVESNEDNNDTVFSANKYAVSGYVARPLEIADPGEIQLKALAYGTVGQVAYVIVDPPEHGTLSVPTGVDVLDGAIEYTADAGYEGPDSFSYYAHDTNSPFPYDAEVVTVDLMADGASSGPGVGTPNGAVVKPPGTEVAAERYERIEFTMAIEGHGDRSVDWYGADLPPGLTIDRETGVISGELTMPGETTSTVIARVGAASGEPVDIEAKLEWEVADRERLSLRAVNDFSTILERRDILIGAGRSDHTYEAIGLPEGSVLTSGQPTLLGTPSEIGDFEVVVNELSNGEVVDSVSFTMTVRPAAKPEFVL